MGGIAGLILAGLLVFPLALTTGANAQSVRSYGLADLLRMAERFSPNLKAAGEAEKTAAEKIRISQSTYYPTLDFTVVQSAGFPASAAPPAGFNGLMDSPYRSGWATGVFSRLTLFDLTREFGVKAAKAGQLAAHGGAEATRLEVDMMAMNLFMDAMLNQQQKSVWVKIQAEINRVYNVVRTFVRNGQYSDVTQWLLKDQSELAQQRQEVFELGYQSAVRRLELLTGSPEGSLLTAGLTTESGSLESELAALSSHLPLESPLLLRPKFEAQTSHLIVSRQSAQNWPRLLGIASAGAMNDSRLEPVQNYAAWVGLTFPLFEGFRISAEVAEARAEAVRGDELFEQAQLSLADSITRFSEEAKERAVDVRRFGIEKEYALKAMSLAEHRLVTFVGDLADVRDSLHSYEAAESGLSAARIELLRANFALALIRGGAFSESADAKDSTL